MDSFLNLSICSQLGIILAYKVVYTDWDFRKKIGSYWIEKYLVQEKYLLPSPEKLRLTGKERKDFLLFEQIVSINIGQAISSTFYKTILF
jgi:hypothetical protein